MTWTIPNILSVMRLLAAPMVAVMFLYFERPYADWIALVLFLVASVTDWFDGYLARAWGQETRMGAMIDPIADKAMVVIALMVIVGYADAHWTPWLVLPATVILFREVFVSGLREFLGDTAGTLKVTKIAKWKTATQMIAIAFLFGQGVLEHYLYMSTWGMDEELLAQILAGQEEDLHGFWWKIPAEFWVGRIGLWLLWLAAGLTAITGVDYFNKAKPYLKD